MSDFDSLRSEGPDVINTAFPPKEIPDLNVQRSAQRPMVEHTPEPIPDDPVEAIRVLSRNLDRMSRHMDRHEQTMGVVKLDAASIRAIVRGVIPDQIREDRRALRAEEVRTDPRANHQQQPWSVYSTGIATINGAFNVILPAKDGEIIDLKMYGIATDNICFLSGTTFSFFYGANTAGSPTGGTIVSLPGDAYWSLPVGDGVRAGQVSGSNISISPILVYRYRVAG
jgi:hypothetical protein